MKGLRNAYELLCGWCQTAAHFLFLTLCLPVMLVMSLTGRHRFLIGFNQQDEDE